MRAPVPSRDSNPGCLVPPQGTLPAKLHSFRLKVEEDEVSENVAPPWGKHIAIALRIVRQYQ